MSKRDDGAFERQPRDLYETPLKTARFLLPWLPPRTRFYEPCCGPGKLISHLVGAGHLCIGRSDIERDARTTRYDIEPGAIFISNPPGWGRGTRDVMHPILVNLSNQALTWLLMSSDWSCNEGSGELLHHRCDMIVAAGRAHWFGATQGYDNVSWYRFTPPRAWAMPTFVGRGSMPARAQYFNDATLKTVAADTRYRSQTERRMT
jgi:hypothetical protein